MEGRLLNAAPPSRRASQRLTESEMVMRADILSKEECLKDFWDLAVVLAVRYGVGAGGQEPDGDSRGIHGGGASQRG
ncbi:hypothetical protein ABID95_002127 [Streptomyces atratus]